MESKKIDFPNLQSTSNELKKTAAKVDLSQVFAETHGTYLNVSNLFLAHFNAIPNIIHERGIDCNKASNWFIEKYAKEIKDFYYDRRYFNGSKKPEIDDIFYFLYDDLIIDFDTNCSLVYVVYKKTALSKVEEIISGIHKFKRRKGKRIPEISLLISTQRGIETKSLQISKPKLNIEDNYNDDFKGIHQTILKRLSKNDDKGIVLLHGKPGTGKTSYIRYLISSVKKNVIFLPPNMANAITNPDLISVLIDNPNSIFVIEDAENIVVDRERHGGSPVSALLNLSDGLLSDCLNIQIICSFNTDISKIDSALMRKGRLIAKYEFKELEANKAQMLSMKLGFKSYFTSPTPLTAIYNQDEMDFQQTKRTNPIGFNVLRAG